MFVLLLTRFGEHKGAYCVVASFKDGNKENFVDQINVDELEQKSMERAKNVSHFEMSTFSIPGEVSLALEALSKMLLLVH